MAGRALLVCALCVLCSAAGGWAWDMDYCTEENWEFLKLLNSSKNSTEILDVYCKHNTTFVAAIKNKLTATGGSAGTGIPEGIGEEKAPTRPEEGLQTNEESSSPTIKPGGDVNPAGGSSEQPEDKAQGEKGATGPAAPSVGPGEAGSPAQVPTPPPPGTPQRSPTPVAVGEKGQNPATGDTPSAGGGGENKKAQPATQEGRQGGGAGTPDGNTDAKSEVQAEAAQRPPTAAGVPDAAPSPDATQQREEAPQREGEPGGGEAARAAGAIAESNAATTRNGGGAAGAPGGVTRGADRDNTANPSTEEEGKKDANAGLQGASDGTTAVAAGGAGATVAPATNATKAEHDESDGSGTAASHSASPLALLLLLACAAAAAVLAA
ncbi:uncharacterized protein Tco025E_09916 [Trypanosoma conorhini]|uniref:Mucin-associated surface protein (MASP) n=1 Tax=Trypanosoma conorhini TaxID=83891 RepID=A0A422MRC7_9TRYP|nr:uncharacterized protein Tco025E_09916 [Trypanosoma conorhini]RNE95759.1 hypothetical protein Tco025E_09916 [Trypanosoma conorhini]